MPTSQIPIFALMVLAGLAVPVLAAMNANLGRAVGNPFLAVTVLCGVAFLTAIILLFIGQQGPAPRSWPTNFASYLGGVLFVVYIGSITYSAPRIGLGNAVFCVLLGQLACAALIDHFGWFGEHRLADLRQAHHWADPDGHWGICVDGQGSRMRCAVGLT